MTRKSVPRPKRDDRPHPSSLNNQQAAGADGVRAKLHDRRRRHQQHGEGGRQLGATNILAVAGVVALLAVAAYYWYISVIRDIVRTPLQAPRFADPTLPAAQQDMERFWGSYRSGLYFGMKTRSPRSPVVGKKNPGHTKVCSQGWQGGRRLTIISRLARRPTAAIWRRVRGANYVIALAFEA